MWNFPQLLNNSNKIKLTKLHWFYYVLFYSSQKKSSQAPALTIVFNDKRCQHRSLIANRLLYCMYVYYHQKTDQAHELCINLYVSIKRWIKWRLPISIIFDLNVKLKEISGFWGRDIQRNKAYYGKSSLSGRVGNIAGRVGFGDEFSCYRLHRFYIRCN